MILGRASRSLHVNLSAWQNYQKFQVENVYPRDFNFVPLVKLDDSERVKKYPTIEINGRHAQFVS